MQSIRVSDQEMLLLKGEAEAQSRSVAGQVQHWLRLGRTIETSSRFNYKHIKEALTAKRSPDDLTPEEEEVYFDEYMDSLWVTTPEQEAYFKNLKKFDLSIGLDLDDNLACQSPES